MKKEKTINMCSGPILINVIRFTIPVMLTGVLQLLFNAADLAVVGRFCGSNAVAAVGATGSLTALMVNFFLGFSVGVTVTLANALGVGEKRAVHRIIHTAIPIAILGGAILTVIGVGFSGEMLKMMGTPSDIIDLSSVYMRIYFCGSIASMVYNFGAAILRAAGDTDSPLKFLTLGGVINVVLNVIFVTVFNMNVVGVALATVISQVVSAVLVVRTLMLRRDDCCLFITKLRIYAEQFKRIVNIGIFSGIQSAIFSISNVLIQSSVNSFGSVSVAGNAAAANIDGFTYTAVESFSQTSVNFVGQNVGAGNFSRVKKIVATCIACVTVVGLALSLFSIAFAPQLLSIYITDNPEAIKIGAMRITVFITYFICGIMGIMTGAIRGLGNSLVPMIISVSCVCGIRIAWVFTIFKIPAFHSLLSLYISYPVSWVCCLICQLIAFNIILKKVKGKHEEKRVL